MTPSDPDPIVVLRLSELRQVLREELARATASGRALEAEGSAVPLKAACSILGLNYKTVMTQIRAGQFALPYLHTGSRYYVAKAVIERVLNGDSAA